MCIYFLWVFINRLTETKLAPFYAWQNAIAIYLAQAIRISCRHIRTPTNGIKLSFCIIFFHISFHCLKSVRMRCFFWSVFSRIQTEYREILYLYTGKYGPEKLRVWTLFKQCSSKFLHNNSTFLESSDL